VVTSNLASHLSVAVACGSSPCESESGRAFLQERVALFAKVVFILAAVLYVLGNTLYLLTHEEGWSHWLRCDHNHYHLLAVCVLGVMWFLSARGKRSLNQLKWIDMLGTFLACSGYVLITWSNCSGPSEYQALLGITTTLMARAILVPSTPKQTLWLGVAVSVPTLLATYSIASSPARIEAGESPLVATVILMLWCGVAVVVATVGSRVIYGLRREVREASKLGQYTLQERIGGGGMGEVYKASHAMLRRPTAVKMLRSEVAGERNIARFEREVQLTSRLTHPNTIAIFDYGRTQDGVFYYAMEYLPGITLEDLTRLDGPQPEGRIIHVLRQVCASLGEAHAIGLIHRDIKGANVILCERGGVYDVAKVVDFGLVKDLGNLEQVKLSAANVITGTPLFLSPESIRSSEAVDARTDIYALGVLGYHLLTAAPIFEGENFVEICGHHMHTKPRPPSERISRPISGDLESVLLACLEKDPDKRPADVRALSEALAACRSAGTWTKADAARWWRENSSKLHERDPSAQPTATVSADEPLPITQALESLPVSDAR
jgi:serine/threonine-protein kinase